MIGSDSFARSTQLGTQTHTAAKPDADSFHHARCRSRIFANSSRECRQTEPDQPFVIRAGQPKRQIRQRLARRIAPITMP